MMAAKLWAVYVGGRAKGCQIELHDMRFCVGETIEDCHDALRAQWWGTPESLHIDAFGAIEGADGFSVVLGADGPAPTDHKLWFVNLGGYDPEVFDELHRNVFVAARDAQEARRKAMVQVKNWVSPHKDTIHGIDDVIDVGSALASATKIRLAPGGGDHKFRFEARYIPIGKTK